MKPDSIDENAEPFSSLSLRRPGWAVGGILAGFSTFEADGELICSYPELSLTPGFEQAVRGQIDLNGDGVDEVNLVVNDGSTLDPAGHSGQVTVGALAGVGLAGVEPPFLQRFYPTAFQPTASVGFSLNFEQYFLGIVAWSSSRTGLGSAGEWYGGNDAYIGVQFDIGGVPHYGWIHTVWDPDTNTLTVDRVAYEDSGLPAYIFLPTVETDGVGLSIARAAAPDDDTVELRWPVRCGYTYELERTDNLSPTGWSTIFTTTPSADGEAAHVDTGVDVNVEVKSFYRVKRSEAPLFLLAMGRRRRREKDGAVGSADPGSDPR